jgi:hypothetical protein
MFRLPHNNRLAADDQIYEPRANEEFIGRFQSNVSLISQYIFGWRGVIDEDTSSE